MFHCVTFLLQYIFVVGVNKLIARCDDGNTNLQLFGKAYKNRLEKLYTSN